MRVGILGGGQLAWMLGLAAQPLGIDVVCWDTKPDVTASRIGQLLVGSFTDKELLQQFVEQVDVVTVETENIPLALTQEIAAHVPFYPGLTALEQAQDRWLEKTLFQHLKIPTPQFRRVDNYEELVLAIEQLGFPAILKTRRLGYDGKGQYVLRELKDLTPAWKTLGNQPLIIEERINFDQEVSLIAVRNQQGEIHCYPLALNYHYEGILRTTEAPYAHPELQQQAVQHTRELLEKLDYVGVIAVEFFQKDNTLLANEIAPRVHNSGHWSIEGAVTSQFESHIRAICQLPLGDTSAHGYSIMFNCIGSEPKLEEVLAIPDTHYYTYRKQPRPGRKLGHITLQTTSHSAYVDSKRRLAKLL